MRRSALSVCAASALSSTTSTRRPRAAVFKRTATEERNRTGARICLDAFQEAQHLRALEVQAADDRVDCLAARGARVLQEIERLHERIDRHQGELVAEDERERGVAGGIVGDE